MNITITMPEELGDYLLSLLHADRDRLTAYVAKAPGEGGPESPIEELDARVDQRFAHEAIGLLDVALGYRDEPTPEAPDTTRTLPAHLSITTAPTVTIDEGTLYRLMRHAGHLAQGASTDWGDEAPGERAYLNLHATETHSALEHVRDALVANDPDVADDGMWCKIGL